MAAAAAAPSASTDIDLLILFEDPSAPARALRQRFAAPPISEDGRAPRPRFSEFNQLETSTWFLLSGGFDARPSSASQRGCGDARPHPPAARSAAAPDRRAYKSFNGTVYQLEPDSRAPGGLRDITAARHIRLRRASTATSIAWPPAAGRGRVSPARALVLHVETGRDVNVLSHDLQEDAGRSAAAGRPAGSALMGSISATRARSGALTRCGASSRRRPPQRSSCRLPLRIRRRRRP